MTHSFSGYPVALKSGVTNRAFELLASAGCGANLEELTLEYLKEEVTNVALERLGSAGCGQRLTALKLEGLGRGFSVESLYALAREDGVSPIQKLTLDVPDLDNVSLETVALAGLGPSLTCISINPEIFGAPHFEDADPISLFASHIAVLYSLGNSDLAPVCRQTNSHILPSIASLLSPTSLGSFEAVATCLLPENIWGQVLSFADYQSMSQCHAAEEFGSVWVSREWYYLLKNSVRVLPLLHAPTPLCGLVWVHSRCAFWASTSTIEASFSVSATILDRLLDGPGFHSLRTILLVRPEEEDVELELEEEQEEEQEMAGDSCSAGALRVVLESHGLRNVCIQEVGSKES